MLPRVSPGLTCLTAVRLAAVALGSVFPAMLRLPGRDGKSSPAATAAGHTGGARWMPHARRLPTVSRGGGRAKRGEAGSSASNRSGGIRPGVTGVNLLPRCRAPWWYPVHDSDAAGRRPPCRATASVITPVDNPTLSRWIRREGMAER
ncbi:hypothetical protein GCM10010236_28400 [Streptomyces eurythermus]|nr:hypothetical protein GCM10010236_28400 [Streptomyces eurythermus]